MVQVRDVYFLPSSMFAQSSAVCNSACVSQCVQWGNRMRWRCERPLFSALGSVPPAHTGRAEHTGHF
jgi:hypothetical protein